MRKTKTKAQINAEETRARIFHVAIDILKETGYEDLTIRRICEEADISNGGFYHHFKSKDELLSYYYTEALDVYQSTIEKELEGKTLGKRLLYYYLWFLKYTTELGADFCTAFFNPRNKSMNTNATYNALFERNRALLKSASEQLIDPDASEHTARELCVISKGIIFDWCSHNGDYDITKLGESIYSKYISTIIKPEYI